MGKRHEVSDEEWAILDSVIQKSTAKTGRPARDRREMLKPPTPKQGPPEV